MILFIGWIDRWEGAVLGVSTEISQISELDGVASIFPYLLQKGK